MATDIFRIHTELLLRPESLLVYGFHKHFYSSWSYTLTIHMPYSHPFVLLLFFPSFPKTALFLLFVLSIKNLRSTKKSRCTLCLSDCSLSHLMCLSHSHPLSYYLTSSSHLPSALTGAQPPGMLWRDFKGVLTYFYTLRLSIDSGYHSQDMETMGLGVLLLGPCLACTKFRVDYLPLFKRKSKCASWLDVGRKK